MPQHLTHEIVFRPASEKPGAEMAGKDVLVYNPCDGWHEGTIHAMEDDGEVWHVGIYAWPADEMTPHDFYVAWARLPDGSELDKHFESERNPYWHSDIDS